MYIYLDHVAKHICAGMSTAEIDKLVYDYTTEHGGSLLLAMTVSQKVFVHR